MLTNELEEMPTDYFTGWKSNTSLYAPPLHPSLNVNGAMLTNELEEMPTDYFWIYLRIQL